MVARKYTQQLHSTQYCTHQKACASTCLNNISANMSVYYMSKLQHFAEISSFLISLKSIFYLL